MKQKLNINLDKMIKNIKNLDPSKNSKRNQQIKKQILKVGYKVIEHIFTQYPTPPIEFGNLRGGFNIIVDKKPTEIPAGMFSTVRGKVGRGYEPDEEPPNSSGQDEFSARIFNGLPYALYIHEGMTPLGNDYKPGEISEQAGNTGGGFMSLKIMDKRNQDEYKEILGKVF